VDVALEQSSGSCEVYDFIEVALRVAGPDVENPFTDATVTGAFGPEGADPVAVDGFCDSMDGTLYRIRFMPQSSGSHTYSVTYRQDGFQRSFEGSFQATDGGRKGILRVDPEHPWHFIWEGTGEHFFLNGTTTYYLMGWDEGTIRESIDRLAGLGVNRIRVLLYGRNHDRPWGQPVVTGGDFALHLEPWVAQRPTDIEDPGFDLTRFDVDFWRKYERMLDYARERDVTVSVIFFIGGQVLPTPFAEGSEDEDRYYRYGVARLGAFSNITWDLGNEHDFHRTYPDWANTLGPKVNDWDPYGHLNSAHNKTFRGVDWIGMQLIQRWDLGQYEYVIAQREQQAESGRIVPQVIEEYGYEDLWENYPGHRDLDSRRRCAWEIYFAGGYQTTGESARQGTGVEPDTGGGWVNGRGDDTMVLLEFHQPMIDFFTSFPWWRCAPMPDLASAPGKCLAEPGQRYAVYLPGGGSVTVYIEAGQYSAKAMNCRTGEWVDLSPATAPVYTTSPMPDTGDWALLLNRTAEAADTSPPTPVSVIPAEGGTELVVTFAEPVDPATATDPDHYAIDGLTVESAELVGDYGHRVLLTVSGLERGRDYGLAISGVADRATPPNVLMEHESLGFGLARPELLLSLSFEESEGDRAANDAPTDAAFPFARLIGGVRWSDQVAGPQAGASCIDMGIEPANRAVDLVGGPFRPVGGLGSFTITGWLNSRDNTVGPGGNRILTTINHGADGFDLVMLGDGSLQLSVNQWPDGLPTRSSPGKVAADPDAATSNWTFFAVTYDSTARHDNVHFYFGDADTPAERDVSIDYPVGVVGSQVGPSATVGNFNLATRTDGTSDRMFRGLIDEIRLYGSWDDGAGALGVEDLRRIQAGEEIG
jgi:hypothetical protein